MTLICIEYLLTLPCGNMQEMSHFQMTMEKSSMQKCLLYYESLHGRPVRPAYTTYSFLSNILFALTSLFVNVYIFFACILRLSLSACLQSTRQERTLMKPFYDQYRLLKQLLFSSAASTVITTIVSNTQHRHTGVFPLFMVSKNSESFTALQWLLHQTEKLLKTNCIAVESLHKSDKHDSLLIYGWLNHFYHVLIL